MHSPLLRVESTSIWMLFTFKLGDNICNRGVLQWTASKKCSSSHCPTFLWFLSSMVAAQKMYWTWGERTLWCFFVVSLLLESARPAIDTSCFADFWNVADKSISASSNTKCWTWSSNSRKAGLEIFCESYHYKNLSRSLYTRNHLHFLKQKELQRPLYAF